MFSFVIFFITSNLLPLELINYTFVIQSMPLTTLFFSIAESFLSHHIAQSRLNDAHRSCAKLLLTVNFSTFFFFFDLYLGDTL